MHKKPSQTKLILAYLKKGRTLSPLEALKKFGCMRLSGRVYELVHGTYDGKKYKIEKIKHAGKQFAVYKLKQNYIQPTGMAVENNVLVPIHKLKTK